MILRLDKRRLDGRSGIQRRNGRCGAGAKAITDSRSAGGEKHRSHKVDPRLSGVPLTNYGGNGSPKTLPFVETEALIAGSLVWRSDVKMLPRRPARP